MIDLFLWAYFTVAFIVLLIIEFDDKLRQYALPFKIVTAVAWPWPVGVWLKRMLER